jgi:hypothetical protein
MNQTPQQRAMGLLSMTPEQLSELDHATLYQARSYLPKEHQGLLAPYEHRAFAREAVGENKLMALPVAAGTMLYQPYKALMGARSKPSLNQLAQGLLGVKDGLLGR